MRHRENSSNKTHRLSIEKGILMSKVGVMMSADSVDEKMSSHFGKAEWIMVADTESPTLEFVKNDALNGKGAVVIAIRKGCSDMILTDIGDGALGHLQTAHIRAWAAPEPVVGSEALRMFREGQLPPVPSVRTTTRQDPHKGCCCSQGTGSEGAGCGG
jgi:predicted Fe-Mo cluster-binding NifX family protein